MIYLVSKQGSLYESDRYKIIDKKEALDRIMSFNRTVQYDSETEGLDPYTKAMLCAQFGNKHDQVVVDTTTIDLHYFSSVFKEKELLGWNLSFDIKFLYHIRMLVEQVWDGMIAEKLLYLGYPPQFHSLSLQSAAKQYLGINLDKTIRGKICNTGLTEDVIVYAANDVVHLEDIRDAQLLELKKKDLLDAVDFENKFVPVVAYMEYCGARIDVNKWREKMRIDLEKMRSAEDEINRWVENYFEQNRIIHPDPNFKSKPFVKVTMITNSKNETKDLLKLPSTAFDVRRKLLEGSDVQYTYGVPFDWVSLNLQGDLFSGFDNKYKCNINWNSSKQVVPLFELLGINCTTVDKKTKLKTKSADIKIIEPQNAKCSIIEPYIKFKKAGQLVKSFGEKFLNLINPVSGRIHANFYQLGCDTGRLSSSDPNLQNLPRDKVTRACFIAEPGNSWISCDYSGQESFLMASIANDQAMLDELVNGSGDMHSLTAKMVFEQIPKDMPLTEIKDKFHDLRQEAKGYEFCFNYGGDWNTLMQNYGLKKSYAKKVYDNYMSGFSGLKRYQDIRRQDVVDKGYILLNNITRHKAFIYDWDHLCRINDSLENIEAQYALSRKYIEPDNPYVKDADFLKRRISDSMKQSINYPIQHGGAMCFKLSAIKFFNYLKKNNLLFTVKYCIPVHDKHACRG